MKRKAIIWPMVLSAALLLSGCACSRKTNSGKSAAEDKKPKPVQTEQPKPTVSPEAVVLTPGEDEEESEILTNEGTAEEEAAARNTFAAALPFTSGDDKVCAVAYMGNTEEAQEQNLQNFYKKYFADYPQESLTKIPKLDYGGTECYLIVPRYKESRISLNRMELKDQYMNLVQTDEVMEEAFLLYCNPSLEYANAEISISYQDKTFVIMPRLDAADHRMENMQVALDLTEESVY